MDYSRTLRFLADHTDPLDLAIRYQARLHVPDLADGSRADHATVWVLTGDRTGPAVLHVHPDPRPGPAALGVRWHVEPKVPALAAGWPDRSWDEMPSIDELLTLRALSGELEPVPVSWLVVAWSRMVELVVADSWAHPVFGPRWVQLGAGELVRAVCALVRTAMSYPAQLVAEHGARPVVGTDQLDYAWTSGTVSS